jgi:hypothetical protein
MKSKFTLLTIVLFQATYIVSFAQTNTFPSTGNVGIGTLTPAEKLCVITGSGVSGITQSNGVVKVGTFISGAGGYFGTVSNHPLYLRTNNGAAQVTLLQNGNMGIGTTTPEARFSVFSGSGVPGFQHTNGVVKFGTTLSGTGAFFGTVSNHALYFRTNNSGAQMTLLPNGNFGIGTVNPAAKLDVNGSDAFIQKVRVGVGRTTGNMVDSFNTAVGRYALENNDPTAYADPPSLDMDGDRNTALGYSALRQNIDGRMNTAVGAEALMNNTNGVHNTALGFDALVSNISGSNNTAVGSNTLFKNKSAFNTAVGAAALYNNTDGYYNTAIGYNSLNDNQVGYRNTSVGYHSMAHSSGTRNTAIGANSLEYNYGNDNIGIGLYALTSNTSGSYNVAIGSEAMLDNKTGYNNVGIGVLALINNSEGHNLVAVGDSALAAQSVNPSGFYASTAVGSSALRSNQTGFSNTATGYFSLRANIGGNNNCAFGGYALSSSLGTANTGIGLSALLNNTSGNYNTAIGSLSNTINSTGSYNTALGAYAGVNTGSFTNSTAVGYFAINTASNQVMLGNASVTSVRAAGSFVIYSDGRFKKEVKENVPGLEFINQLRAVTYHYDVNGMNTKMGMPEIKKKVIADRVETEKESAESKALLTAEADAIAEKEKKVYTGFIAQEVEQAAKKLQYDFSGLSKPQNDKDLYGLSYAEFVVPLVKSVQELSKLNDEKDAKINALEMKSNELQKQIDQLKDLIGGDKKVASNLPNQKEKLTSASLEQNTPNPFKGTTSIGYTIPLNSTSARIVITDAMGKKIKEININIRGKGSATIDADFLNAAAYQYSLYVNDNLVETKKMILSK